MSRAAAVFMGCCVLQAQGATVETRVPQDGAFSARVTSIREARYSTTLHQQFDFSCGSAAVATLLTHQYGVPVAERDVFGFMYEHGDRAKIRREGFSMLDMKRYLAARGFSADGFQQPLERLGVERLPAIVLLNERGYRHFVVVKGLARGLVLVGDPAAGTRTMTLARFRELWTNGILFVVHSGREQARFNQPDDWRVAPAAPLQQAIDRERLFESLPVRQGVGL
jgi:predicted double-glycine peptidase